LIFQGIFAAALEIRNLALAMLELGVDCVATRLPKGKHD
jgi:hypothetical protein